MPEDCCAVSPIDSGPKLDEPSDDGPKVQKL
jgi:hypothetical protein